MKRTIPETGRKDLGDLLAFAIHARQLSAHGADHALRGHAAEQVVLDHLVALGHNVALPSFGMSTASPWAYFDHTKAAVQMRILPDLRGNIPMFIDASPGYRHDVNVLDDLLPGRSMSWTGPTSTSSGSIVSISAAASSS